MTVMVYGLLCLFVGSLLFRKAAGGLSLKYANIVTLAYYYLLISFLMPAFSNAAGLYSDWMSQQAVHADSALLAFYATFASFVALPGVILFLQKLLNIQPQLHMRIPFESPKQNVQKGSDAGIMLFLTAIAIVLSILLILLIILVDLPIETLIRGGTWLELAVARRQWVMNEARWAQYVRNIVGRWVAPLASLIALGYLLLKRRAFNLIIYLWLTVLAAFYLFSSLERAPLINFIIASVYLWMIFRGGISFKHVAIVGMFLIIFGSILFYITLQPGDFLSSITHILERILFVQYSGTILTFDLFPHFMKFLGIHCLCHGLLGRLLGCDGVRYSLLLMQTYNPVGWSSERAGYVSTLYIAEGYACFGIPGIVFSVFLVGLWLTSLQWLFSRVRPHPVSLGFLSMLTVRTLGFVGDGIFTFLYPSELLIPTFIVILLVFWIRRRPVVIIRHFPSRVVGRVVVGNSSEGY